MIIFFFNPFDKLNLLNRGKPPFFGTIGKDIAGGIFSNIGKADKVFEGGRIQIDLRAYPVVLQEKDAVFEPRVSL